MNLLSELKKFDGKRIQPLEKIALQVAGDSQLVSLLIGAAESDDLRTQTAATWVLRRVREDGHAFSDAQCSEILKLISSVDDWEARLHLLQLLPQINLPKDLEETLFRTIANFLDSEENKFVRAWSYNALISIADQASQLRDETSRYVSRGQREEAASIKARIRNAAKQVDWL